VTIYSSGSETFRGFLIQGIMMADDTSSLGTFVNLPSMVDNTNLTVINGPCPETNSSVTHYQPAIAADRSDVMSVQLTWQAPDSCSGPVQFR